MGRKIPLPITTPSLVLRRFTGNDWKDLLEFLFEDEESALIWLEKERPLRLTTPDETFSLAVQIQDGGKVIGCLGLRFTDRGFLQTEISAAWNEKAGSQDQAREAVVGLLGFCFKELKLHRVVAPCGSGDAASCRLFEAVGMRREGEFVKHYCVNGEWLSTVYFAMLDEEFRSGGS